MVFVFTFSLLGYKPLQFSCFTHMALKHCLQCRRPHIKPSSRHPSNSAEESGHFEGKSYLSNCSSLLYDGINSFLGNWQHINTMQRVRSWLWHPDCRHSLGHKAERRGRAETDSCVTGS